MTQITKSPALPAGEPEEQVVAILDRPDAAQFIAALHAPTVHRLIHDAGWDVAQDLVPHLSVEQLQTCLDLDCWSRHEFVPQKVAPWLAALVSGATDEVFRRDCREIDAEILALLFREYLLVDVWGEEGEVPDALQHEQHVERSPDGVYALVYRGDDATNALLRAAIARFYEVDRVMAWTLIEAARWELKSNMEEEALRWRTSRLEEWGFVQLDEALQIYRPLDGARYRERLESGELIPKQVGSGEAHLPAVLDLHAESRFYATEIIARLQADSLNRVMAEFVALQNRAAIGEGIDAGDRADTELITERTTGYLSIGLEFLSRRDDARAEEILSTVPLRDVFRVGFTTVDKLRDHIRRIRRRPALTLVEGDRFSLLGRSDAALCEALSSVRPAYAARDGERTLFGTQAQVDDAATRLALIAFKQVWLFGLQHVQPADLVQRSVSGAWKNSPIELGFDVFFATAIAHVALGEPPSVDALAEDSLGELARVLRAAPFESDLIGWFEPLVGPVLESLGASGRMMSFWLEETVARLIDELGSVVDPEPALLTPILVLRSDDPAD